MAAALIVLRVEQLDEAKAQRIGARAAERYASGLVSASADPDSGLVTILARADSDVTVESVVRLLADEGLEAHEATEEEYDAQARKLQGRTLEVPAAAAARSVPGAKEVGVQLTSLADSLEPLRNRFNDGRGKLRFIAVLSPT